MWPQTFPERLTAWAQLRDQAASLPLDQALEAINTWWFQTPWRPYHLHWDDLETWPDPWQLLDDNIYCGLARGLGIMYTITMLDRSDLQDAVLTESDGDNLVLIDKSKYILNWDADTVVNTNPEISLSRRHVSQDKIKQQLR
jgi:hypothetical protein